ncbi:MAG TPA: hypothetical protein VL025_09795, partial [Thermoanaerobaculia bacterium]|nr:hypothetical protein [Thermoanaerobaculia bacterium]
MPQILRKLISRGFSPEPDPPPDAVFWVRSPEGDWTAVPPGVIADRFETLAADTLCVLLPTYVSRCPLADQLDSFDHIVSQAREAGAAHPQLQLVFVVGMQLD